MFHHFRRRQSFGSVGCLASQLGRIWANAIHNQRFVHYVSGGACYKTRFDDEPGAQSDSGMHPIKRQCNKVFVPPFEQSNSTVRRILALRHTTNWVFDETIINCVRWRGLIIRGRNMERAGTESRFWAEVTCMMREIRHDRRIEKSALLIMKQATTPQ